MPSRFAIAGIFAFWLITTGYIAYRDLWPRMFASGPPPVSIELADEARQAVPARWALYRNGQRAGRLTTQMKYLDSEDAFLFTYNYSEIALEQGDISVVASEAVSEVRMSRAGNLLAQTMTAKLKVLVRSTDILQGTVDVRGVVTNGVLTGRAELKSGGLSVTGDLDPVEVKDGQPLNPLQPVNRLGGITGGRPGWKVAESNPLQDAVAGLLRKKLAEISVRLPEPGAKDVLVAEVDRSPRNLNWKGEDVPCWVIEYRRTEPVARTWVRVSDGKVLRQEAFEKGESLTFERED